MSRPENEFPTIDDTRTILDDLAKDGFGGLPVQIIMVPSSTMQALARHYSPEGGVDGKVAAMIEMTPDENGGRIPVCIVNADGFMGTPPMGVQ